MNTPGAGNGGTHDPLEDVFPVRDGRVQLTARAACPYCWKVVSLLLDPGSGPRQDYVEECPVCCRPWSVSVRYAMDGSAAVTLEREDEG